MRKVAVVGIGETKFTAAQEKTEVELFAEAAMDALNESSLKPRIFKLYTWVTAWGISLRGRVWYRALLLRILVLSTSRRLGLRVPVLRGAWQ